MRTILLATMFLLLAGCTTLASPTESAEYQTLQRQKDEAVNTQNRLISEKQQLQESLKDAERAAINARSEADKTKASLATTESKLGQANAKLAAALGAAKEATSLRDEFWRERNKTSSNLVATAAEIMEFRGSGMLISDARATGTAMPTGLERARTTGMDLDITLDGSGYLLPLRSAKLQNPGVYYDPDVVEAYDNIVCTGSMRPTLDCGDTLIIYEPSVNDLKVGDIISYTIPTTDPGNCAFKGQNILHRVSSVQSSSDGIVRYQLKGDANARSDDCTIPFGMVNWKVAAVVLATSVD